jgi:predicted 3-demethylubiquinone-9 3-methyltransferase (glyoxalase superfamily)
MAAMQKITPFLWFDRQAEEAARFYVSIFGDSKILNVTRYGAAGPGPAGSVMSVTFQLAGQRFMALNGGPHYRLTEAFSLFVECETQREVDDLWARLTAGGEPGPCGWLKDKFGLSWQVMPSILAAMLQDTDPVGSKRAIEAMLKMSKLDIATLQRAYDGAP